MPKTKLAEACRLRSIGTRLLHFAFCVCVARQVDPWQKFLPLPPLKPALSIVIPAYNEAGRLPRNLPLVAACCDALDLPARAGLPLDLAAGADSYEVLVMVERSTDGTLEKAREAAARFPRIEVVDNGPQRGKGHAVRSGMLRAAGEIVLFMDADLSTPLDEIGRFLDAFAAQPAADVLIGNRRHADSHIGRHQGSVRRNLGRLFNSLVTRAGLLPGGWRTPSADSRRFGTRRRRRFFRARRWMVFPSTWKSSPSPMVWGCAWRICPWPGTTPTPPACACGATA